MAFPLSGYIVTGKAKQEDTQAATTEHAVRRRTHGEVSIASTVGGEDLRETALDITEVQSLLPDTHPHVTTPAAIKVPISYGRGWFWKTEARRIPTTQVEVDNLLVELLQNEIALDSRIDRSDMTTSYGLALVALLIGLAQAAKLPINAYMDEKDKKLATTIIDSGSSALGVLTAFIGVVTKNVRDNAIINKKTIVDTRATLEQIKPNLP